MRRRSHYHQKMSFDTSSFKKCDLPLDQFAATFKLGLSNLTRILALLAACGTVVGCEPTPTSTPTLATEPPVVVESTSTPSETPSPATTVTATVTATPAPDYSGYTLTISSSYGEYTCSVDAKTMQEVNYLFANCPQTPKVIEGRQAAITMLKDGSASGSFSKVDTLLDLLALVGIDPAQVGSFIPSAQEGSFICVPNQPGPFLCGADYEGNLLLVESDSIQFVPNEIIESTLETSTNDGTNYEPTSSSSGSFGSGVSGTSSNAEG